MTAKFRLTFEIDMEPGWCLFAIVFGLSMNYEVFLLSRMKEEYDRTGDNAEAVADGLASTGGSSPRRRRSCSSEAY